jgi:membrane associated rhomboid family serine protease
MAQGSRVCPNCGRLNAAEDKACYNCGKRLPGPLSRTAGGFLLDFSRDGLPATKAIAAICIVVYGLMMLAETGLGSFGVMSFHSSTTMRFGALWGGVVGQEPWRLLSAVFLHAGLLHIVMNMLGLVNLGRALEPHWGSARFLLLYLISGVLGFAATVWWRGEMAHSVGASGAIFGLLGAFIGALIIRRNPGWQQVFMSNLIMAFMLGFVFQNVDNTAHAGGFVAGLVMGLGLELEKQPRKRDRLMAVLALVGLLAVPASIALSARSPVWKEFRRFERAMTEEQERRRLDSE